MKPLYFLVLFFVVPMMQAQVEGVEKEIMEYQGVKSELIAKGRRLLLDKFLEGDIEKVKEVKDYLLTEVENKDYIALFPGEKWIIMYWTGEYESLMESILQFNPDSTDVSYQKFVPEEDMLYAKLKERSWEQLEMLENKINNSELELPAKDFLLLHLNFMVSGEPVNQLSQEEVNTMADLYLETHPGSTFEEHIRNNLRYKFVPHPWGLGIEMFGGYGMFKGELSEMYTDYGIFGIGIEAEYQKFNFYLRNYIGFSRTKQEQEKTGVVWERGSRAAIFFPEVSIGYAVVDQGKIRLSPYAGIGLAEISPPIGDIEVIPELTALGTGLSPTYSLGVNLHLKLGWKAYPIVTEEEDKSHWFIRIRYGYAMPRFNEALHNGNIHQITIGFGGMFRGMKRVI